MISVKYERSKRKISQFFIENRGICAHFSVSFLITEFTWRKHWSAPKRLEVTPPPKSNGLRLNVAWLLSRLLGSMSSAAPPPSTWQLTCQAVSCSHHATMAPSLVIAVLPPPLPSFSYPHSTLNNENILVEASLVLLVAWRDRNDLIKRFFLFSYMPLLPLPLLHVLAIVLYS